MSQANQTVGIAGDTNSVGGVGGIGMSVDPTFGAARMSLRGADYQALGSYRIVVQGSTSGTVGAGSSGIIASLIYGPAVTSQLAVVTRLAIQVDITGSITTSTPFDFQAFIARGATGKASGTASTVATLTGNNQKLRTSYAAPGWAAGTNGEMRTIGGSLTTLVAAGGKTNDSQPMGFASIGTLYNSSSTGTAVKTSVGAAVSPGGWNELFAMVPGVSHPIVLAINEGFEIQTLTAQNATGTAVYAILIEWSEVNSY